MRIKLLLLILLFALSKDSLGHKRALNSRSDSLDIKHVHFTLDSINFSSKWIKANTTLDISAKIGPNSLVQLDLLQLQIDSIWVNNVIHPYLYNDTLITLNLTNPLNAGDSLNVRVFYQGQPKGDAQWGGFYFNGPYAFNMGVGFSAQPHNFGRCWHPCFDNFVERSTYEYHINTGANQMAVCNGNLVDTSLTSNGNVIWHWSIQESIPTYLAGIAISNYVWTKDTLSSIYQKKASWIASLAADTNKVKASFAHLQNSFSMLEAHFGPYRWNKVGYTLVPFSAGAMEHATCIHIGTPYIDGSLNYETLIAHELSHHWFGDLATCRTAQDMWLNEGWASYCELLHTEYVYGAQAYKKAYRDLHFQMLFGAHIKDKGYRAVSNIDSNYTYGTTVYSKGSDMIHTLRSYLGDTVFFNAIKQHLNTHQYKDVSTQDLSNSINSYTGKNYSHFFNDWINQPGFTNFCIDSMHESNSNGIYSYSIFVRQRKHKNSNYYTQVPLEFCFYKNDFSFETYSAVLDDRCGKFTFSIPYQAAMITLDDNDKLSDAATTDFKVVNQNISNYNLPYTKCRLTVNALKQSSDSSLFRIEQHWVAPDRFWNNTNTSYVLNDVKYWHIDGVNIANLEGKIGFLYDARAANNFWDSTWLKNAEDSIKLFYRKDATENWAPLNDSLAKGAIATDKFGYVYSKEIIAGDYALAIQRYNFNDTIQTDAPLGPCSAMNSTDTQLIDHEIKIYPNPSQNYISIEFPGINTSDVKFKLYNVEGKTVLEQSLPKGERIYHLQLDLRKSIYFVELKHTKYSAPHKIQVL